MDKELSSKNTRPEEIRDFIEKIAGRNGSHFIFKHGYNYVDNVEFWKWIKNTYKDSKYLSVPSNLKNVFSDKAKASGIKSIIRGKGAEWDWVKSFNNNPKNQGFHLPPEEWKIAKLSKDVTGKTDAYIKHLKSGHKELVQIKTATTDNSAKGVARKLKDRYPGHRMVANEKLAVEARKAGVPKVEHFSDKQMAQNTQKRTSAAKSGTVSVGYTIPGVLKEVGYGAVVGAVVQASIASFTNYKRLKNGEITDNEFWNEVGKDSAYGATSGGAMAGINVVIQSFAIPAGIGAPVTIPVLILAGYGLDKLIAPAFGKGAYGEMLQDISFSTDMQRAFTDFAINSYGCFCYFEEWLEKMKESHNVYKYLEATNKTYNAELKGISSKL